MAEKERKADGKEKDAGEEGGIPKGGGGAPRRQEECRLLPSYVPTNRMNGKMDQ